MSAESNKTKWLKLRVSVEELVKIKTFSKQSTARNFSNYCRDTLLKKPVIIKYRNQSLDDFLTAFLALRKDLNGIANNFNQSVKRLHQVASATEAKQWLSDYESERERMFETAKKIQDCVQKISAIW